MTSRSGRAGRRPWRRLWRPSWPWLRRFSARIGIRLLAFNLLLVFLPAAALLVLDTYERQLLDAQERSMVQQARMLAASLSGGEGLDGERAKQVLVQLAQRQEARLRVVDADRQVVADSSLLGPRKESADGIDPGVAGEGEGADGSVRDEPLYRLGAFLNRIYRWVRPDDRADPRADLRADPRADLRADSPGRYQGALLEGPAVDEALAGRYGADVVAIPETRSVVLHSAIPVTAGDGSVVGAVLVSRSTSRILAALYEVRLGIFQVFLVSVGVAVLITLLLSGTIARPLQRLRNEASALLDRRGRITGRFRGTRRADEIGDLARALAELTRRLSEHQRFTESFASDVSHELKNPLASLRTATEMLADAESEAERERLTRRALGEVARLENLLTAVGEIGRIDAELEEEAGEPVAVGALVETLVEGFRMRCTRGPRLVAEVPEERVEVVASPDRLAQVIENLLDNAVSFTEPEGRVAVSVERRNGTVVVAVADTGPGIPDAHFERLFDRFFSYRPATGDGSISQNGYPSSHNGLGLAIARAIVERYGGEIRAVNRPEGGARFEVELPAAD